MQNLIALCSDGMHNKFKVSVKNISYWKDRINNQAPTIDNLNEFLSGLPWDESINIYKDSGVLHSAYTALFTNGAQSVDAIILGDSVLWNKYESSNYILDVNKYK